MLYSTFRTSEVTRTLSKYLFVFDTNCNNFGIINKLINLVENHEIFSMHTVYMDCERYYKKCSVPSVSTKVSTVTFEIVVRSRE